LAGLSSTVEDIFKTKKSKINLNNLQNSGVSSDSIIVNISQYLLIILVAIILMMMLATLLIIPSLRKKVKELIKKILRNLKFNTVLMYVTGAFIDLSFSLVT
jgi:hypothetical protein